MFGNCTILNKINQVKRLATQTELTLFLIQRINLISYLDFSTESTSTAHVVPAKTTAGVSDVPPNLQVELAAVKCDMQQFTAFLVHLPHDSSAGKYSAARGSNKDQEGSNDTRICAHFENKVTDMWCRSWRCTPRQKVSLPAPQLQRSINEGSNAVSPPSYRCVTCQRWGISGSGSTGICCGISCECDSEDHSDRRPALTWWCVWKNPKGKE